MLPRYDPTQSYEWNYAHAPEPVDVVVPTVRGEWSFLGRPIATPLGIPAGPLLNGKWCLYYASLGFDVLTYKTVRSRERQCYEMPNLQPVSAEELQGDERLCSTSRMRGSWAVSFGMPSKSPAVWRADIEQTRNRLPPHKRLVVSVVATEQPGWTLDDLARDYAQCAVWAIESGADAVELNFSCPNVSSSDAQLFQDPVSARRVAQTVRDAIGQSPLIIKIGHVTADDEAGALVENLSTISNAISMVNCIAARVMSERGELLFGGGARGVAGDAIRLAALKQVALFHAAIERAASSLELIAVGGIATSKHVDQCMQQGAGTVQIATAAMLNPEIAIQIRNDLELLTSG